MKTKPTPKFENQFIQTSQIDTDKTPITQSLKGILKSEPQKNKIKKSDYDQYLEKKFLP